MDVDGIMELMQEVGMSETDNALVRKRLHCRLDAFCPHARCASSTRACACAHSYACAVLRVCATTIPRVRSSCTFTLAVRLKHTCCKRLHVLDAIHAQHARYSMQ